MKMWNILTSKAGKFVLGLPQKLALTAGLGVAAAGVVYMSGTDKAPEEGPATRSSVMSTTGRNAGNAPGGLGAEETIKISGAEGISSAGSYSAASGYDWEAADASVAAVDNIGVKRPATRAMAGHSEGLGGNNDIVVVDQKAGANSQALAAAGAAGGARAAAAMQRGVMASASGGVTGNTYGGASTRAGRGPNSGTVNRSGNSLGVVGDGYKLSGAMPGGSTAFTSSKFQDVDSSFPATRGAHAGRGMASGEGRTLTQIAKRSADIAQNKYRSANEAGRAFLASSKNSGGVQLDNGDSISEGAVSEDFEQATINARKKLGDTSEDLMEKELERQQDRTRLKRAMVALVLLTIPAMIAISALAKKAPWGTIAAVAIGAAMTLAIGLFMADAIKFMNKWGGSGLTTACMIVGPVLLTLIGLSYVKAVADKINSLVGKINNFFGGKVIGGSTAAMGTLTGASNQIKSEMQGLKSDDGELADKNL